MIQGCYKCGGKIHETGGTASNVEGMSQEQQMLMMIASTLQSNISKHGQEEGVQMTLQLLAERGLIDPTSEEGMQQGISLLEASINYVDQAHGGRNVSQEGLPQYTSGGYDDMRDGGSFSPHEMYKGDDVQMARSYQEHLDLAERGYDHNMAKGGEMIRRADGSYSRRGFWDNIRDAAGSGNPVTPEMRATEKKLKKAQSGEEKSGEEQSLVDYDQGVLVENQPASPFIGAISPTTVGNPAIGMNYYNNTSNVSNYTTSENMGGQGTPLTGMEEIKMPAEEKKEDTQPVTPAYTAVHSGIGAVQLKDEKDANMQQRWLNTMAFANTPTMSGNENLAGWGSLFRGIAGASTIPRTISNTIRGARTHQAQSYDASGNKLGDPQYIEHSDWKDMQKERRTIARNQRREDRSDTGMGRLTNRIVEAPEKAHYGVKGMFQKEEGGEWNPFEDNRPKVRMNIHKPMFVEGGEPFPTFDEWRRTPEGAQTIKSSPVSNAQDLYNKAKADWEAQQSPVVKQSQIPEVGADFNASNNTVSENSSITNQNQSNTSQANASNIQPYTQYGTDQYNTLAAATASGSLSNLNFGLANVMTSGYDQRNNLSQNIQTYGTMGQKASNPQDPRMGGPLAAEFSNVGFTGNDPGAAKWYSANAGDKGMSTLFGKNGGQMYEVGGEYDLTDEELMMLKSMGYEYEALRK